MFRSLSTSMIYVWDKFRLLKKSPTVSFNKRFQFQDSIFSSSIFIPMANRHKTGVSPTVGALLDLLVVNMLLAHFNVAKRIDEYRL